MSHREQLLAAVDWDQVAVCDHDMVPFILQDEDGETKICRRCGVLPAQVEPEDVAHVLDSFLGGDTGHTFDRHALLAERAEAD